MMKVLALSGSLRAASSNTNVLLAAMQLVPREMEISLYRQIGKLPHFDPDTESAGLPFIVKELRSQVDQADALLICCPEYAHGVPGSFKNALDWLVGMGLSGKHIALLNASPRSTHAQSSLAEILRTMDANIVDSASVTIPLMGRPLDASGIVADPELSNLLRTSLAELIQANQPKND